MEGSGPGSVGQEADKREEACAWGFDWEEGKPAESDERGFRPIKELFYWPLAAAFLIALFAAGAGFVGNRWPWPRLVPRALGRGVPHG
jgi:hypothetical protein